MTKRIFSLITAIAVMTTMLMAFSIDAGAAVPTGVFKEDFSNGYTAHTSTDATTSLDNGAVKVESPYGKNFYYKVSDLDGTNSVVLEFDMKLSSENSSTKFAMYFYVGAQSQITIRSSSSSLNSYNNNNWYRWRVVCNSDGTKITGGNYTIYNADGTVAATANFAGQNNNGVSAALQNSIRIQNYTSGVTVKYCIDNFLCYSGVYVKEAGFKVGTTPVTQVSEIPAAGGVLELSASIDNTLAAKNNLGKFMVAFDKNGKMLDCSVTDGTQTLATGDNTVTATMTLDASDAAAIADDGYVGFYLWNNMWPEIQAIELN